MKRAVRGLLAAVGLAAVMGLAALGAAPAQAQAVPAKTRVYVVVIDGLRPDEVASMPFLASLASTGSYYTQGRGVMVAETIPNHVAMVTGVYPDRNGIVANSFPDTATGKVREAGDPALLTADSMFTLVEKQCPQLTTAAVTSKDYLYTIMNHDRTGDGKVDADINFNNTKDPTFIPGLGLTPDERTIVEATQVARSADPDFLFVNLGSVDRVGHVDPLGGTFTLTGTEPPFRAAQRTLTRRLSAGICGDAEGGRHVEQHCTAGHGRPLDGLVASRLQRDPDAGFPSRPAAQGPGADGAEWRRRAVLAQGPRLPPGRRAPGQDAADRGGHGRRG